MNRPALSSAKVSPFGELSWLTMSAGALTVAAVVAPSRLASVWAGVEYGTATDLADAISMGFIHFWSTRDVTFGHDLDQVVRYWGHFHFIKSGFAAILLVVLIRLAQRMARAYVHARDRRRGFLGGAAGVFVTGWMLLALVVLVANVQGAVAPLSSALSLLPLGTSDPVLTATTTEVRIALTEGAHLPILSVLVNDFILYHAVMAALGIAVSAGLLLVSTILWRRRRQMPRSKRPSKRVFNCTIGGMMMLTVFFGIVTVANLSTVARPIPALADLFVGGL